MLCFICMNWLLLDNKYVLTDQTFMYIITKYACNTYYVLLFYHSTCVNKKIRLSTVLYITIYLVGTILRGRSIWLSACLYINLLEWKMTLFLGIISYWCIVVAKVVSKIYVEQKQEMTQQPRTFTTNCISCIVWTHSQKSTCKGPFLPTFQ